MGAEERLASCSASDVRAMLEAHDMHGLVAHLHAQSVHGADFLALTEKELVEEVRATPFVAKKLLSMRTTFLNSPT